jgi:hypothetical protein
VIPAAIIVAALCIPGAVLLWRLGELWLQTEFLEYRRQKHRESADAAVRQAHEIQAALTARIDALNTSLSDLASEYNTRLSRLEQGRTIEKRVA